MANYTFILTLLSWFPIGYSRALPIVDPGLFVISGVSTCGFSSGYCLLGVDCTLNEDFLPDVEGHCEGLKNAFTPRAYFVCCRYKNRPDSVKPLITLPVSWSSLPSTDSTVVEPVNSSATEESPIRTIFEDPEENSDQDATEPDTDIMEDFAEENFQTKTTSKTLDDPTNSAEIPKSTNSFEDATIAAGIPADTTDPRFPPSNSTSSSLNVDDERTSQSSSESDNRFTLTLDIGGRDKPNDEPIFASIPPRINNSEVQTLKFARVPVQKFLLADESASLYNRLQEPSGKQYFKDQIYDKNTFSRDVSDKSDTEYVLNSRNVLSKEECIDMSNLEFEELKTISEIHCLNKWRFVSNDVVLCFGVLINPLWIVTSASCITRIFHKGMEHVKVFSEMNEHVHYKISNMIVHENYKIVDDATKLEMNNIGLVSLSNYVDVSCLPCIPKQGHSYSEKICTSYNNITKHVQGDEIRSKIVDKCEGRVKSSNTFGETYLTLPCKSSWHGQPELVENPGNSEGSSLWCGDIFAGVETGGHGITSRTYTPIAEFSDWIVQNIKLYIF